MPNMLMKRFLKQMKDEEKKKIPSKKELTKDDKEFKQEAKHLSKLLTPIAKGKKVPPIPPKRPARK